MSILMSIGGAGSVNDRSPRDLPLSAATYTSIWSKAGPTSANHSQQSGFYIYAGAYHSGTTTIDTWNTLCDITGEGIFGAVCGKYSSVNPPTVDYEITIDGTAFVVSLYVAAIGECAVLGGIHGSFNAPPIAAATYITQAEGAINILGSQGDHGHFTNKSVFIPHPMMALAYGIPVVRFRSSLKVRERYDVTMASSFSSAHYMVFG